IGSQYLLGGIDEEGNISPEAENMVMADLRAHFRPEFLNRLDETILFRPLTRENNGEIVKLMVKDVNKRLQERDISLELTDEALKFVADNGYDPTYGARPLKRYLQKYVETAAAKIIVTGNISQGDTILVDVEDGKLTAKVK
ncbi:MAG: type VI secretion system ATPase TssH, partial [Firmicutes bacterium]|nr:type VI secretion system ATPase TssH [Bacillota bacterium]